MMTSTLADNAAVDGAVDDKGAPGTTTTGR
jgi:hypothetical protein